jgi:small acid-soluble spore protein O
MVSKKAQQERTKNQLADTEFSNEPLTAEVKQNNKKRKKNQ